MAAGHAFQEWAQGSHCCASRTRLRIAAKPRSGECLAAFSRDAERRRVLGHSPEEHTVPSLFVMQGRDQGTRFRIDDATVTLGRGTSNAVQLHDTEVSREHAEIRRRGDAFVIRDLDSSNGTFVNGQPVTEQRAGQRRPVAAWADTAAVYGRNRRPRRGSGRQDQHRLASGWWRRFADRALDAPIGRQRNSGAAG